MVQISLSALLGPIILITQLTTTLALPMAQDLNKRGTGKRLLAWDYTNTNNPAVASQMNLIPFDTGTFSTVHNWNTWYPPELNGRAPFQPMVRTRDQLSGSEWTNLLAVISDRGANVVHYFNEPEVNGIGSEEAANLWRQYMVPLRNQYGVKLTSPAVQSNDVGTAWLADFMSRVSDVAPDYLAIHYYGTDPDAAKGYLDYMHTRFPLPIIVSEIACISRDSATVWSFTTSLVNWMDATDYISLYAWFGAMTQVADDFVSPAAQLMTSTGAFTDLMWKLINVVSWV